MSSQKPLVAITGASSGFGAAIAKQLSGMENLFGVCTFGNSI